VILSTAKESALIERGWIQAPAKMFGMTGCLKRREGRFVPGVVD
jgi:hypothetical protein